ncbi:MAG: LPS-assembly protein LptD [Candidatus Binataceae bacterium]|nr:LPS-assembly protein LptD [Candidatus Binataceae bacterium]
MILLRRSEAGSDRHQTTGLVALPAGEWLIAILFLLLAGLCYPSSWLYAAAPVAKRAKLPTEEEFISRQIRGARPAGNEKTIPTSITGRKLIYHRKTDSYTVYGNAKLVHGTTTLSADKIELRHQTEGIAEGHVLMVDPVGTVKAEKVRFNLKDETAVMDNGEVSALTNYHLTAKVLKKLSNQQYEGTDATITTCRCSTGVPDWGLSAQHMTLHYNGEAKAQGAYFDVLGHPLVPIPFAQFDTNSEPHSGLLSPRYGISSLNGFEFEQPYFIDLSKSQDLTAQMDIETSARIGGQMEYRIVNSDQNYLSFTGDYFNESIRSQSNRLGDIIDPQIADPHIPIQRWGLVGVMQQYLTPSVFLYGNAMSAGDSLFFREIGNAALSPDYGWNSGAWQTARDAISNFGVMDEFNDSYLQLESVWNQDLIQPQRFALQTLPQLLWSGYQSVGNGLAYLNYDASAVDYWRQAGYDGQRLDLNPTLTVPWAWSRYLDGWASVGVNAAAYNVSGKAVDVIPVGTHGLKFNNGLLLDGAIRNGQTGQVTPDANVGVRSALVGSSTLNRLGIGKVSTLIQPFVQYSYVPIINQSQMPLFDSLDRLEPRSLITYGTSLRLFGESLGGLANNAIGERAKSLLGPSFTNASGNTVTELLRMNIEQAYDTSNAVASDGSHLSDVAAQVSLFPTSLASGSANVDWSPRPHQGLDATTFSLAIEPPNQSAPTVYTGKALQGSYLQFSYSYAAPNAVLLNPGPQNAISAISMQGYVGILNRLGVYFAPIYDVSTARLLASVIGTRIKSSCDCWIVDIAMNQTYYPKAIGFTFQITLGGLGSIGGSPFGNNPFQMLGFLAPREQMVTPR